MSSSARITRPHLLALSVTAIAALTSTFVCKLVLAWLFTPVLWAKLFYLKLLVFSAFAGLWGTVLFPRETREVTDAVTSRRSLAPLAYLAVLAATAATIVSCGDLAFEWGGTSATGTAVRNEVIWGRAWITNSTILFAAYALIFALTARLATAVILISPLYLGLVLASVVKINYMDTAVHPLDVLRIPEFVPFVQGMFGTRAIVAVVLAVGLWLAAVAITVRTKAAPVSRTSRSVIAAMTFVTLAAFLFAFSRAPFASSQDVLRILGAPGRGFKEHARRHGVVLGFLSNLPAAFPAKPHAYSPKAVEEALRRTSAVSRERSRTRPPVNLVFYLVEAMMDPADFGVQYTFDPIPTIRSLRRTFPGGWVIVPEAFSGSVNTEFEILTGMSMCYLPQWSLAYRQYLRHPIPSLPRTLKQSGYRATAVQTDPKFFFARERAYDWLGFDDVKWLDEVPGVPRAVRGISPSDAAVVDAIVAVSQQAEPFFIFAFTGSTHAPYNEGTYRDSALDVVGPIPTAARNELKEYINALSVADREIARLLEHFRHQPSPTMVVIMGDHLPPLSSATRSLFIDHLTQTSELDRRSFRSRRVPMVVWTNFELPREELEFSANALPAYVVEKLSVEPDQLLIVNEALRRTIPVLGEQVPDCGWGESQVRAPNPIAQELLSDYQLLQYDVLIGSNYSAAVSRPSKSDLPSR